MIARLRVALLVALPGMTVQVLAGARARRCSRSGPARSFAASVGWNADEVPSVWRQRPLKDIRRSFSSIVACQ